MRAVLEDAIGERTASGQIGNDDRSSGIVRSRPAAAGVAFDGLANEQRRKAGMLHDESEHCVGRQLGEQRGPKRPDGSGARLAIQEPELAHDVASTDLQGGVGIDDLQATADHEKGAVGGGTGAEQFLARIETAPGDRTADVGGGCCPETQRQHGCHPCSIGPIPGIGHQLVDQVGVALVECLP